MSQQIFKKYEQHRARLIVQAQWPLGEWLRRARGMEHMPESADANLRGWSLQGWVLGKDLVWQEGLKWAFENDDNKNFECKQQKLFL